MRTAMIAMASAALLLAGCASPQERSLRNKPPAPNPSAIIAAELAYNRLTQEKGVAAAFRETAHKDAVMFLPKRTRVGDKLPEGTLLSGLSWAPHAVYASCDGSAGATVGVWQGPGKAHGYFTTIWLRERDGRFKWVLTHGGARTGKMADAPDFIQAKEGKCGSRPAIGLEAGDVGDDLAIGLSFDQTLSWRSLVRADGSRRITVRMWDGTAMVDVIDDVVSAEAATKGG
jgi:hypothetical protein